jgi:ABC-2 type transport system permease protein
VSELGAVFTLTVRQLAGSRRLWLVLALVSLPVLAGVLFTVAEATATPAEFADSITRRLLASAILPLVMLLLATAAFGNEVGDRTLVYLVTKPLARWRIVVPKLAAAIVVGGLPVAVSAFVSVVLIQQGDARGAAATGAGLLVGAITYAAIFTWAGLATRHALVIGLVYVFVWEAALAAYLDGIRFLSVRRFTLAIVNGLDERRLSDLDLSLGAGTAAVGAAIALVGFTALTTRKLRRMDVP